MIENIWYAFQESDGVEFLIQDISKADKSYILKEVRKKGSKWRRDELDFADLDWDKYSDMLIRKTIVDWKGLKNKHLDEIFDIDKEWEYKGTPDKDGKFDAEHEIKFSKDQLREIAEKHDPNFAIKFLKTALDHIDELKREEKRNQLKNL